MAKFTCSRPRSRRASVASRSSACSTSVVSVYYYLRLPVLMYMREPVGEAPRRELASRRGARARRRARSAVLFLGIFPNQPPFDFLSWIHALDWSRQSVALLP